VLLRIEERLARVEDSLRSTISESASTPGSFRRTSFETTAHPSRLRPPDEARHHFQRIVSEPRHDFNFRQTAGEAVTARPSIISFHSPYYLLHFENWDDSTEFYDDELALEEELFEAMEAGSGQGLDMTPRTVWQLQQNFVLNFLQWMPLFEVSAFSKHMETAQSGSFCQRGPSDCIVMFALAVGTLDRNRQTAASPAPSELYPGLHYFQEGRQILMSLSRAGRKNITILQC
jgi:hypothetical protein